MVFVGDSFVVGLLGKKGMFELEALEKLCKETSTKEVKCRQQDQVKFDFKEKGKKPVLTKGICQFAITGSEFSVDKITELLKSLGLTQLE